MWQNAEDTHLFRHLRTRSEYAPLHAGQVQEDLTYQWHDLVKALVEVKGSGKDAVACVVCVREFGADVPPRPLGAAG